MAKDIKLADDGDMDFSSGDLNYTDGTRQHKRDIIIMRKGEMKRKPEIGLCAADYLLDNSPSAMLQELCRQYVKVGMKVSKVAIEDNKIVDNAGYENI